MPLLAASAVSASAQTPQATQEQAPPQTAPPKGKVLFERHEPAVTPDPPTSPPADQADDTQPTQSDPAATRAAARPGVSSSQRRSRTALRRRVAEPAADPNTDGTDAETPPVTTLPAQAATSSSSSSSSSATEDGEAATASGPIVVTAADLAASRRITTAERRAVAISSTDLEMHLNAHTGETEVRAQLTLRNDGATPLAHLPLRISGALRWESIRIAGSTAPQVLEQHGIADDLDHTGVAAELVYTPAQPLPPGETVALDLYYGGTLAASTQRLLALGAPSGRAALTDWDTVTDTFTGLRGLGNVEWYPVAGLPASLRDGDAVTAAVETSRTRNASATFHLRLTLQYSGSRPDAAFFCGARKPLIPLAGTSEAEDRGGAVTAEWQRAALGQHTPSLLVASGAPQEVAGGLLRVVTDRADRAAALGEAAARLRPMMAEWLGAFPARPLDVIDLPIPDAAGFADGSLLVAPLSTAPAAVLAPALVQPLTAAWLPDGVAAPWLREGLPAFLQAVWAERTEGRTAALRGLAATSAALRDRPGSAAAESASSSQAQESPATPAGPSLASCADPVCARGKAAYVFEMLRGMLGDSALQQAISGWRVQQESGRRTAAEETSAMERLLQQVAGSRQLDWFFHSWIDADAGLPELTILTVAPRRVERSAPVNYLPQQRKPVAGPIGAEPVPLPGDPNETADRAAASGSLSRSGGISPAVGSWLVAVEVQNSGSADAEVPVTVRSGGLTNTLPLHIPAHGRATVRVPFEADPTEVLVNDGSVPELHTSQHRRSIANLPTNQ